MKIVPFVYAIEIDDCLNIKKKILRSINFTSQINLILSPLISNYKSHLFSDCIVMDRVR